MRGLVVYREFNGEKSYLLRLIKELPVWTSDHSVALNYSPTDIGAKKASDMATKVDGKVEFEPEDETVEYKPGYYEWLELEEWLRNQTSGQFNDELETSIYWSVLRKMNSIRER